MNLTPRQYEELVAAHFRERGFSTEITPCGQDYGVDVFATKGREKLAIQAKMYGGTARKVNREMMMQLHGAKEFFDCTKAVMVTDGEVAASAADVASKLGIEVVTLVRDVAGNPGRDNVTASKAGRSNFDEIWERDIIPLAGRTLVAPDGRTNVILKADWSGVERLSSNGRPGKIGIEIFQKAIARVFERGCVSRSEINEEYAKRASSGVILILAQVSEFELVERPSGIRLKARN